MQASGSAGIGNQIDAAECKIKRFRGHWQEHTNGTGYSRCFISTVTGCKIKRFGGNWVERSNGTGCSRRRASFFPLVFEPEAAPIYRELSVRCVDVPAPRSPGVGQRCRQTEGEQRAEGRAAPAPGVCWSRVQAGPAFLLLSVEVSATRGAGRAVARGDRLHARHCRGVRVSPARRVVEGACRKGIGLPDPAVGPSPVDFQKSPKDPTKRVKRKPPQSGELSTCHRPDVTT
ncbi:hypothetical protein NDU88_004816 [Pleurodeles waltl]|uniref:Uncharacterized protein n=1 Tax=Pleurodeles waltl TaxID=8319 RepID=A0AAV7UI32_PLEWA|nr:hypothetical protein NDU88_004816 [Pleurodeles waltl]